MKGFVMVRIFSYVLLISAFFLCGCSSARQLMQEIEKAEKWQGHVEFAPEYARDKGPCFVLYGKYPTRLVYKDFIPVDPGKIYTLKASFRTLDPNLPASAYLGLNLYDENKHIIGHYNVQACSNTDSEVISARKGDKFLTVRMIKNYDKIKYSAVAFNTKKDFSDLPNYDISPQCAKMSADKDGNLRIDLKYPLKKDYKKGTPVRLHSPWSPSLYFLASGWMPAGDGRDCTAVLHGILNGPGVPHKKFWKGTKYVRPFVWFGNWNRLPKKGAKLLIDGFSFEESDAE